MLEKIDALLVENIYNFTKLREAAPVLEKIAARWMETLASGKKIMFCGNGGSAADAQHLAAELTGRYRKDRAPLAALSLTVNTSELTAIGNDYGFENIFSLPLQGLGQKGDLLVGISTSGNSANVAKAFATAARMGIGTIAFTGASGGKIGPMADLWLPVPSTITNNIQEMHIACGHILCGLVEEALFPDN